MATVEHERVAEVMVETKRGVRRKGSGYRVTTNTVLTAAHVVTDATSIRVRFNADQPTEWTSTASVELESVAGDVATLRIATNRSGPYIAPVAYGKVGWRAVVASCIAVGFPRFKLRDDAESQVAAATTRSQYRDSHQIEGTISALSNSREGTLELLVPPPECDSDPQHSPWEGMSGAAVWSSGRIVGLVSEHHRADGLNRLAAVRVDRWYELLSPIELTRLRAMADLPRHVGELVDVLPLNAGQTLGGIASWEMDPELYLQLRAEIHAAEIDPSRVHQQLGIARESLRLHEKVLHYANVERLLFAFDTLQTTTRDTVRMCDAEIRKIRIDLQEVLLRSRGVGEVPARRRLQACCHLGLYVTALGGLDQGLSGTELLHVFVCDPGLGQKVFPQLTTGMSGDLAAEYEQQLRKIETGGRYVTQRVGIATLAAGSAALAPLAGPQLLTVAAMGADQAINYKQKLREDAEHAFDKSVQKRMRRVAEMALGMKQQTDVPAADNGGASSETSAAQKEPSSIAVFSCSYCGRLNRVRIGVSGVSHCGICGEVLQLLPSFLRQ